MSVSVDARPTKVSVAAGRVCVVVAACANVVLKAPVVVSVPANVTALPPMELTAVVNEPAAFVMSPVWAGSCAACKTPVACVLRLTVDCVAKAPRPVMSAGTMASSVLV